MFDLIAEALQMNSNCAFCGLEKFLVKYNNETTKYDLVRCDVEDCDEHCRWNHKMPDHQYHLGDRDAISIASGW